MKQREGYEENPGPLNPDYLLQHGAGTAAEHMALERLYFTKRGQANLSRASSDGAVRDMTVHP